MDIVDNTMKFELDAENIYFNKNLKIKLTKEKMLQLYEDIKANIEIYKKDLISTNKENVDIEIKKKIDQLSKLREQKRDEILNGDKYLKIAIKEMKAKKSELRKEAQQFLENYDKILESEVERIKLNKKKLKNTCIIRIAQEQENLKSYDDFYETHPEFLKK